MVNVPPWDGPDERKASNDLATFIRRNAADLGTRYGINGIELWNVEPKGEQFAPWNRSKTGLMYVPKRFRPPLDAAAKAVISADDGSATLAKSRRTWTRHMPQQITCRRSRCLS